MYSYAREQPLYRPQLDQKRIIPGLAPYSQNRLGSQGLPRAHPLNFHIGSACGLGKPGGSGNLISLKLSLELPGIVVFGSGGGTVGRGGLMSKNRGGTIRVAGAGGVTGAGVTVRTDCRATLPSSGTLVATLGSLYSSGATRTTRGSANAFREVATAPPFY